MAKTILVCDDDSGVRAVLERLLAPRYAVLLAVDGREALRLIAERPPDLVLLDAAMPGLGGAGTLAAYHRALPGLPTLVITGDAGMETARRFLELGARAYITKPFDAAALLDEIGRILGAAGPGAERPDARPPWRVKGL